MPTRYTSKLYDGKAQTFKEFTMQCARAFGALIEMRDESVDTPIPEKFEPSKYYVDALAKAKKELAEVEFWSYAKAEAEAEKQYEKYLKAYNEALEEKKERRKRYEAMLHKVSAWIPPTGDHLDLKKFMTEQLETSIDLDCDAIMKYRTVPKLKSTTFFKKERIEQLIHDVEYYKEELKKEVRRADERTKWVNDLRDSLK